MSWKTKIAIAGFCLGVVASLAAVIFHARLTPGEFYRNIGIIVGVNAVLASAELAGRLAKGRDTFTDSLGALKNATGASNRPMDEAPPGEEELTNDSAQEEV
jgi:hypothetical protein